MDTTANKQDRIDNKIDTVHRSQLNYEKFVHKYMSPGIPVIIQGISQGKWLAFEEWIKNDIPNWSFIAKKYGHCNVPVVCCDVVGYGMEERKQMNLGEYIEVVIKSTIKQEKIMYMKDWHIMQAFPKQEDCVYSTPIYFKDDYLNWWYDQIEGDDYRFVYMGPKGSWTPLHQDVLCSYSWSINICGQKKWLLIPPSQTSKLIDRFGKMSLTDIHEGLKDSKQYPQLDQVKWIEVVQKVDEAIFIPSGWYHQVENLEETISINHNWFNSFNLSKVAEFLQQELKNVEDEIQHCRELMSSHEWNKQCQLILQVNSGMDYIQFSHLLLTKAKQLLETNFLNTNITFEIQQINKQLQFFSMHSSTAILFQENETKRIMNLIHAYQVHLDESNTLNKK